MFKYGNDNLAIWDGLPNDLIFIRKYAHDWQ